MTGYGDEKLKELFEQCPEIEALVWQARGELNLLQDDYEKLTATEIVAMKRYRIMEHERLHCQIEANGGYEEFKRNPLAAYSSGELKAELRRRKGKV